MMMGPQYFSKLGWPGQNILQAWSGQYERQKMNVRPLLLQLQASLYATLTVLGGGQGGGCRFYNTLAANAICTLVAVGQGGYRLSKLQAQSDTQKVW